MARRLEGAEFGFGQVLALRCWFGNGLVSGFCEEKCPKHGPEPETVNSNERQRGRTGDRKRAPNPKNGAELITDTIWGAPYSSKSIVPQP